MRTLSISNLLVALALAICLLILIPWSNIGEYLFASSWIGAAYWKGKIAFKK